MAKYVKKTLSKLDDELSPRFKELAASVQKNIDKGFTVSQAVDKAVVDVDFANTLKVKITDNALGILDAAGVPVESKLAARNFWLNHTWQDETMTLSNRINNVARMDDVKVILNTAMKNVDTWNRTAKTLVDQGLTTGELPQHLKELDSLARRVFAGDTSAYKEYQQLLARSQDAIDSLVGDSQLTKAYQNVLDVSQKELQKVLNDVSRQSQIMAEKALDSAIERATIQKARYNAGRIARNEFTKAYAQSEYQSALGDEDVVGMRYELSSAHPEEDICDEITSTDAFGMGDGVFPLESLPEYPFHIGCILPGNKIELYGDVCGATKSLYNGIAITITLANGSSFSITENHPILTNRGWIAAKNINRSDNIFHAVYSKWISICYPNYDNTPTDIEEIFSSLEKLGTKSMPASTKDFHGDGKFIEGNIDIVNINGFLNCNIESFTDKILRKLAFSSSLISKSFFTLGMSKQIFRGHFSASSYCKSIFAHFSTFFWRPKSIYCKLRFAITSWFYSKFNNGSFEKAPTNIHLVSKFLARFPGKVTRQKITNVRCWNFSGHVYNLQVNPYQLYICNGAIVKNCLCNMTPVYRGEASDPNSQLDSLTESGVQFQNIRELNEIEEIVEQD